MNIKTMKLENFAGVSDLTIDFDSKCTFIYGDNGTGKTTVFNAFTWLLTGKASTGAANFTPKTEGTHGLEHSVTATIISNDKEFTLKRTFHEVYKKKRGAAKEEFAGHATDYYIDGVLTKEKDFTKFIEEHIGTPDIIKELSLPEYFSEGESWQNRRQTLLNICGDVSDDDVIASDSELEILPSVLNGRSVDDYIKIVTAEMKGLNKQIDTIPARIDEASKAIPDAMPNSTREELIAERADIVIERDKLKADYSEATHGSVAYNQKLFKLRSELQQASLDYKKEIADKTDKAQRAIETVRREYNTLQDKMTELKKKAQEAAGVVDDMIARRDSLIEEYKHIKAQTWEGSNICPTCGQLLPDEKVQEAKESFNIAKASALEENIAHGKMCSKEKIEELKKTAFDLLEEYENTGSTAESVKAHLQELIDASKVTYPAFEETDTYKELNAKIDSLNPEEVAEDTKEELKNRIAELDDKLAAIEKSITLYDAKEKQEARVAELKEEAHALSVKYEHKAIERNLCEKFIITKVKLLDDKINNFFSSVRFKLFSEQINGGIKEDCEVLIPCGDNLIPYAFANHAARINAGLEIISLLSSKYNVTVPVFIDNAESITHLDSYDNLQLINLVVSEPDKKLRISNN